MLRGRFRSSCVNNEVEDARLSDRRSIGADIKLRPEDLENIHACGVEIMKTKYNLFLQRFSIRSVVELQNPTWAKEKNEGRYLDISLKLVTTKTISYISNVLFYTNLHYCAYFLIADIFSSA